MNKIKLSFLSPKTTLLVGCVLALGAHFTWYPVTFPNVAIMFFAVGLTDIIFPGSAGTGSHGYVTSTIAAVLKVGLFFLPSFALVVLCRNRIPDWITSLLVVGCMVAYASLLFALFPLPEQWP
ncbi:MAG: hypothetical protein OXQ89_25265 [Rhodospirillaceae bacterium]|nr:hypothetical protein [Rhodospirillaceae bacterium]MDE0001060.1 hypothetical protein [Rhodospirillaceae bacterium]MDE0360795.1 hypothetical protein [Rhodospirillaceae bacterium]